jgi:gamma-glutamyltranspeptidase
MTGPSGIVQRGDITEIDRMQPPAAEQVPEDLVRGRPSHPAVTAAGIHLLGDYNWRMGSIQVVIREGDELLGAVDPRRAGYAAGF